MLNKLSNREVKTRSDQQWMDVKDGEPKEGCRKGMEVREVLHRRAVAGRVVDR